MAQHIAILPGVLYPQPDYTLSVDREGKWTASFVGKVAGLVSALNVIPFVNPTVGVIVFAVASILKDAVNRIGDLLDDGKPNQSFKG
jgi:hypothetical protein